MNNLTKMIALCTFTFVMSSCKKDNDPIVEVPPSDGSTLTLNGLIASESGASAGNSVYVDFSKDAQSSVQRISWDLGFSSGADFRVILNNSTAAAAKVTTATSLSAIGATDTIGVKLAINQMAPVAEDLTFFDAMSGSLTGTVIPAVPAAAAESKVIILNRGAGGGIAARPWIKLKVTRNTSGGYTLQYARITETTNFTSIDIPKDSKFNFKYVSLTNNAIVNVEPEKTEWDMVWGYSVYHTSFGAGLVAYNFSDLVFLNHLAGVTAAAVSTDDFSYADFNESNLNSSKVKFFDSRDVIGSTWRVTSAQPPAKAGVITKIFYLVKDGSGNIYKLKFVSFHADDAGVRGKPVIEYKLVKKA